MVALVNTYCYVVHVHHYSCGLRYYGLQALINMCYCCGILLGKGIQLAMFGDLRVSETQVSVQMASSLPILFEYVGCVPLL